MLLRSSCFLLCLAFLAGCDRKSTNSRVSSNFPVAKSQNLVGKLVDLRKAHQTKLTRKERGGDPCDSPPKGTFELVKYESAVGKLSAYLTPNPNDGKKRPAIIWVTGGDCNTIDDGCWAPADRSNDQSASAYRKAGMVMMIPSLRGGNDNPGTKEAFLGEIDDVLSAAEFLAKQPHVDPKRIYLGGHSTGGTVALLAAESSNRFRAVFSFGPVEDVRGYGEDFEFFNYRDEFEAKLRAPIHWLHEVTTPTFIIEGKAEGNLDSLEAMQRTTSNSFLRFVPVGRGGNHVNILGPLNDLLAKKIAADTGETCNIELTAKEAESAMGR